MGTTCNEGPLHTTILRQIYLYWQWPFETPEKIVGTWLHVIIGAMWIARPWRVTSAGSVLDCPIKVGEESTVFSTLLVLYSQLNNCVSCYAGFDEWWYTFEFEVWILAVYDPISLVYVMSKHRLSPRALSWCNTRERSSLCLPSARCEPCVLE